MKKFLTFVMCAALIVCTFICVPKTVSTINAVDATVETNEYFAGKIVVAGTSELKLVSDMATVDFGIETINTDATKAQTENAEKINSAISILTANGISKENIKTIRYNMFKRYDYSNGQTFMGYQVTNSVQFKTTKAGELNDLITKLTAAGVNNFNGITFSLSSYDAEYDKALALALNNATSKAHALAPNKTLKIVCIKENNQGYEHVTFARNAMSEKTSAGNFIEQGEVCVNANVLVTFEIV